MADKLVRLPQLQRFKTNADLKYQDKLTAGNNITISNNVISAQTFGQQNIYNATITSAGWSGTSNTVSVLGISAGDDVEIVGINPTGLTNPQINAAKNALYLITYGTTAANAITFYALGGLPSVDIPVTLRKIEHTNLTAIEYTAGASISLNNGVISATPVFQNGHSISISGGDNKVSANTTKDIYTATRNCKFYFNVQCQNTDTTARTTKVYLNSVEVYSQYVSVSTRYTRILNGCLILSAGDVVSIQNPYGFEFEVPCAVFYE
jgi:hypothetical protein